MSEPFSVARMIRMHHESVTEGVKHVQELEEWFDEELKCEIKHSPQSATCTVEATHRIFACKGAWFMCKTAADLKEHQKYQRTCVDCLKPADKCWEILPL